MAIPQIVSTAIVGACRASGNPRGPPGRNCAVYARIFNAIHNASRKKRSYELSANYRQYIGNSTAKKGR